jgi:hypothetical protein
MRNLIGGERFTNVRCLGRIRGEERRSSWSFGFDRRRPPEIGAGRGIDSQVFEVRSPDPISKQLLGVRQRTEQIDQLGKQPFRGIGHASILAALG